MNTICTHPEAIMRARVVGVAAVLALAAGSACKSGGSSTTSPAAILLALLAGDAQSATVGHAVATAPSVTVTSNSQPKAGVTVIFAVASGGGSVTGATATTDANGTARVGSWTLGTTAGANSLTASVTGATPVTFTATGTAGPAAVVSKSAGDGQTASAGLALATKPAVLIADQNGNPVAGTSVTFAVASGGGSVSGATATTGANGIATVGGWTLGNAAGANTVTATAAGAGLTGNPQTFTATGVAGPVATLTKVAGDNLAAVAGTSVATSPAVRLADQFGNLVSSQTTTFAVASGGGSVTGATPTSGANGVATLGSWTLGAAAGTNTLTVSSGSAPTVTFTATGTAAFNAAQYVGNYSGTWTNTTFASTGTSSATVSVNSAASTMSIVFAVTGTVLGQGGVNTTQGGSYTANGASVANIVVPVMGTVTCAIDAGGNITASGANVPNPAINRWSATGTITPTQVRLTFTVTFTDGSTAVGNIALNHT
jgi:adhesin/invasin